MNLEGLKQRARQLKTELYALWLAYKDPRVPLYARIFAAGVVAYAFSPIDLIPDFVPVLGYLDDLLLVPLGIVLARRMIPPEVMADCRARSAEIISLGKPVSRIGAAAIVIVWLLLVLASIWLVTR